MKLTKLFTGFFESEKASGIILVFCTIISLLLANVFAPDTYTHIWHAEVMQKPVEFWINDLLMTIFFLLIGLEMEREIYIGELSSPRQALLPGFAAIGGMILPALIHYMFNAGTPAQAGFGIPMATDIAFSLGVLSLLGNKVPVGLKIFLTALAIIDDLGAIIVIAIFYSDGINLIYLGLAAGTFAIMFILNRLRMHIVWIYLLLGAVMWYFTYRCGIHPTVTGVFLAFAIPFGNGDEDSPSYMLQHYLHKIVAFGVLPLFALANTAIVFGGYSVDSLFSANTLGIVTGLFAGKSIGVFLFASAAIFFGVCSLPFGVTRRHLFGAGLLAGIGFTMSIFITLLAFNSEAFIVESKIAVLLASVLSGVVGYFWLKASLKKEHLPSEGEVCT